MQTALRELRIIIDYEPVIFNHSQFHQLIDIAIHTESEVIHTLVMYILDKITEYQQDLLNRLVPLDFLSLFFEQLPNKNLLIVMIDFIPVLKGLPEYLAEYGIFQLLEKYVAEPIPEITKECLTVIKRLAKFNYTDISYIEILCNYISIEDINSSLLVSALDTISAICEVNSQARAIILKNFLTPELLSSEKYFKHIIAIYISCFLTDFDQTMSLITPESILPFLSFENENKVKGTIYFFYRISKTQLGADLIWNNTEIFHSLIQTLLQPNLKFKIIQNAFKAFTQSVIRAQANIDPKIFLENDIFSTICEMTQTSHRSQLKQNLNCILKILEFTKTTDTSVFEELANSETLFTLLDDTNNSKEEQINELVNQIYAIVEED
ncbi:hypothetical protein TVAG_248390 [Trichomonas vaginalis G3]|uniref:Uncharacterized protein n=1 Tax=Trichomonas vaginalis (strain ATCC PRA-98 / G3) TaxID=412133 RepID=A2E775_TRIV3|nr:armadillo (ARM) repeat-containing protein family [Trichomonas vaginalis G3]EAY11472.1 hypothetical protein TVAG_248390 [Trichomonas vaginalis G3]KAI5526765.1 armadillo (ARM) repeat-containing protein family [Trichomonas vaginalis G3]|eukprot:XP_001323695.1 hypothetical protein [Trichomonas vaginalis G3]